MCVRESSTVGTATTTISSLSTTESQISSFSNDFMTTKSATEATSKPNIQLSSTDHLASTGHLAKTTIRPNEYESPSPSVTAGIASGDNKLATNADKSFVDSSDSRISAHNTTLSTAKHINNEQFTTEGTSDFRNLNGNPFSNDSDKLLNQLPTDLDVDKSALNQMNLDITNLPNPANNLSLIASIVSSVVSTLVGLGGIGAIGTVCYQRVYKASRKSPEFTVEIACANDSDNAEKTEKNTDAEEIVGNSEPPKADEHLLKASNVSQNKLNPFLNSSDSEDFDKSSSLKQRMNDFFSSNDSHRPDKRHKNFDTKTEAEKAALIDTTDPSQNFEIVDETIHRPDQQKMIDKSDHFHLPKLQVIEQSDNPPRPPKRLKKSILSRIDIDSGLFELGNLPIVNPDINELCNDVTWEMARPIPSVRPTLQMTTATVHTEAEMSKSKKLKPQRVSWHDATVEQRKSTGPILPPKLPEKSPNEKPVNGKDKTIVEIPEYFEAPKKDLPTTHIPHKPLQNEPTAKAPIEQNYHIPAQLLAYSPEKDNLKELPRNSVLNSQPTSSIISDFDPLREFNNDYMPKSIADNSDSHEYQNMLISQADEHLYDSVHSDLSRRSTPNSDVQPSAKIIARNLPKKPSHLRRGNYIKSKSI